jgi:hypothetical protein
VTGNNDKPLVLKFRESTAIARMYCTTATAKFQSVCDKDSKNFEETLHNIEKAVECIEFAHDAAMKALAEFQELTRYRSKITARGVRLSAVKQHQASNATIAELVKKP